MTKVELQSKIEALQAALQEKNQEQNAYKSQIDALTKQLEDLNKPKLTMKQFDTLTETIECAVDEFDFSDTDNYSVDFHIDYDNRIAIESFSFDNSDELVREICESVYEMFGEAEEDDNQLNQD
jgi:uncharacterized coiled-coil protein SlyX